MLSSNLAQRLVTAVVLFAVALGALFLLPTWAMALVFGVLWLAGAWEWAGFAQLPVSRWWLVGVVAALLLLTVSLPGDQARLLLWLALVWWLTATVWLFRFPTAIPTPAVISAGILVLVPSWLALVELHGTSVLGPRLALAVLIVVWAADIGAYFTGRAFGRTPLAPRVSPKKTWEGVAGGLMAVTVLALVIAPFLDLSRWQFLAVALVAAVASIVGDLTVSMFKRHAGLKDSGMLFPGHGGVMDRVDSISAASPIFCLALAAVSNGLNL